MFEKVQRVYAMKSQNMTDGLFPNALPVLCSRQVFLGGIFGELLAFQEALRRIVVSGSIFEVFWGASGSQVGLPNGMKIEEHSTKIGFPSTFVSESVATSTCYQFWR